MIINLKNEGYIKECTLYPFDFEEFLWANGISDEVIASVKKAFLEKRIIDNFFHDLLNKMLINYIVVGGMPSVITTFLKDKNMTNVYEEQKSIIQAYRKDIDSHLSNNDLKISFPPIEVLRSNKNTISVKSFFIFLMLLSVSRISIP